MDQKNCDTLSCGKPPAHEILSKKLQKTIAGAQTSPEASKDFSCHKISRRKVNKLIKDSFFHKIAVFTAQKQFDLNL